LTAKVEELRRDLFSARLHSATTPVKDNTSFKKMRRAIACALTYLHQRKEGVSHGTK
jgi:ribosomal protein L29